MPQWRRRSRANRVNPPPRLTQLKIRRRGPAPSAENDEHGVDFWAQAGGGGGGGGDDDMGGEDATGFGGFGDGPAPFNTQILNDDDDDDYDDGFAEFADPDGLDAGAAALGDDAGAEVDLMEAAGQLHRVRPENVNYAKRAKRVDVKKLKDTIWKELRAVTIEVDKVRPPTNTCPS